MLDTRTSSETPWRQHDARSQSTDDRPLVVVIDPRRLIGQCTAVGLQNAGTETRFRSCRTVNEWLDDECESTTLPLLSGSAPDLDREIASIAGCQAAPPFAVVSPDTDPRTISGYLHKGARGFIATSQPRVEVLHALQLIAAGKVVVPVFVATPASQQDRAASAHA